MTRYLWLIALGTLTACAPQPQPPSVVVRPILVEPPSVDVNVPALTQSQRQKILKMRKDLQKLEDSLSEMPKPLSPPAPPAWP